MLTSNIDILDKLSNGVVKIYIKFDDQTAAGLKK